MHWYLTPGMYVSSNQITVRACERATPSVMLSAVQTLTAACDGPPVMASCLLASASTISPVTATATGWEAGLPALRKSTTRCAVSRYATNTTVGEVGVSSRSSLRPDSLSG